MDKIAAAFLIGLTTLALILLSVVAGTLFGAVSGAIVGYFFPGTVGLVGSVLTGGAIVPAWQIGAALGFVGGYFRKVVSISQPD
jgi:hypothetical protein